MTHRDIAERRYVRKTTIFLVIGIIIVVIGILVFSSVHSELIIFRGSMVKYRYDVAVHGWGDFDYEHAPAVFIDALGWWIFAGGMVFVIIGLIYLIGRQVKAGFYQRYIAKQLAVMKQLEILDKE